MFYSEELVEEVRTSNDILDVVGQYVRLQKKGTTYFGLCPFHNEKSPSFSVTPSKQMYYCFGCHAGGNVLTFVMEYENYTFVEALKYLADRAGIHLPDRPPSLEEKKDRDLKGLLLEINKAAGKYFYYQMKKDRDQKAYRYLTERGLSDETIRKFGLGYSNPYPNDLYQYLRGQGYSDEILKETGLVRIDEKGCYDKFWNRVMFPIMDVNSRVIGFGGRVMGQGEPKYLNSPETKVFDKGRNLYGMHLAKASREPYLLICEGYMDTIALHQAGFSNAAACLGTAMTEKQAALMKRYTDQVVLSYDSDGAGIKAALRAIPILKGAGLSVKVLNMKPYKDPDEFIKNLGADAYRARIEEASGSFLFEISRMAEEYDMKDPESKTKFHKQIASRLAAFSSELERKNYAQAICDTYHIPFDNLYELVAEEGRRMTFGLREKEEKTIRRERGKEKEDGNLTSQKLMLTWLIEIPELFRQVKRILSPKDFTDKLCGQVAEMVWEQLEQGLVNPAKIVNHFINDEEEYKVVAGIFNTKLRTTMTKEEQEKAFSETVYKVKKYSLDQASLAAADAQTLQKVIAEQAALKQLHIRFDQI